MADEAKPKPPDRSRRAAILATVGIVVIMGLAVFVVVWVVPFLQTRAVVQEFQSSCLYPDAKPWIRKLGGPEEASRRLRAYLRLPKAVAPHRIAALTMYWQCGARTAREFERLLGDDDRYVRQLAAAALKKIRGEGD